MADRRLKNADYTKGDEEEILILFNTTCNNTVTIFLKTIYPIIMTKPPYDWNCTLILFSYKFSSSVLCP